MNDFDDNEAWNPDLFECPKCKTQLYFQLNDGWVESPITQNGNPLCSNCWNDFLLTLGIEMQKVEKNG